MRYLLDISICIYLIKNQPREVRARLAQCFHGDVGISAITLAELEYGVQMSTERRSQNAQALTALLEDLVVAPFDADAAAAYGILRAGVATRQSRKDVRDKLIASHAVALDATLVTNNENDFQCYPGVAVENWVGP